MNHLEDAIRAGDRDAAKRAWNAARPAHARCESFSGAFFPKLDAAIDRHPVGKPAKTGAHATSPILFQGGDLDKAVPLFEGLKKHALRFRSRIKKTDFDSQSLMDGLIGIAQELGHAKVAHSESPISQTSLRDYRGHLVGIEETYAVAFRPKLEKTDASVDQVITADMVHFSRTLDAAIDYKDIDRTMARKNSQQLGADLQKAAKALGLKEATLDE